MNGHSWAVKKFNKSLPRINEFLGKISNPTKCIVYNKVKFEFNYKLRKYVLFDTGDLYQEDNSHMLKKIKVYRRHNDNVKPYYRIHPHGFYEPGETFELNALGLMWAIFGEYDLPDGFSVYPKDGDIMNLSFDNLEVDYFRESTRVHPQPCIGVDQETGEIVGVYSSVIEASEKNYYYQTCIWRQLRGDAIEMKSPFGIFFYKISPEAYRNWRLNNKEVTLDDRILAPVYHVRK